MDSEDFRPVAILARNSNELVNQIATETDPTRVDQLINLFKMNQVKRNIVRSNALNNTLDLIDDEIALRISSTPEQIRDQDLNNYMKNTQAALQTSLNNYETSPVVQINNNTMQVEQSTLNAESRKKVEAAVANWLKQLDNKNVIDVEEQTDES